MKAFIVKESYQEQLDREIGLVDNHQPEIDQLTALEEINSNKNLIGMTLYTDLWDYHEAMFDYVYKRVRIKIEHLQELKEVEETKYALIKSNEVDIKYDVDRYLEKGWELNGSLTAVLNNSNRVVLFREMTRKERKWVAIEGGN